MVEVCDGQVMTSHPVWEREGKRTGNTREGGGGGGGRERGKEERSEHFVPFGLFSYLFAHSREFK